MRPLLCLLLLTGCAVPTEPVVRESASLTMAPLEPSVAPPRRRVNPVLECESYEVWTELWVDGVRYWELLTVLVCP
jgi:hypothetical protein